MNKNDKMFRKYPWLRWLLRRAYMASWRYSFFAFHLVWERISKPKIQRIDRGLLASGAEHGSHSYKTYPGLNSTTRTTDIYATFVVYDIAGFLLSRKIRTFPWSRKTLGEKLRIWEKLRIHAVVEIAVSYMRSGIITFSHEVNTTVHIPPTGGMKEVLEFELLTS